MRSRPALAVAAAAACLAGGLLAGCTSSPPVGGSAGTTATAAPTTTVAPTVTRPAPTTPATTPPTTAYTPSSPAPSPDAAAAALIDDWSTGNRTGAAAVAAPAAIAALFAQPYPAGYLQSRGCTDPSTNPGTCTYANRDTGSLYEIDVSRTGSGWYVPTVIVES